MGNLIEGRSVAEQIHTETARRIEALKKAGAVPGLAFVRVGDDPASQVYVRMKERTCQRLGIHSVVHLLPQETVEVDLLNLLDTLNTDPAIHGILVQAPIPRQIDSSRVYSSLLPKKDVDGFHPVNMGKLLLGDPSGFIPCTPAGIHELLIRSGCQLEGAEVVVLGRGNIVGKPMAALLVQKIPQANATVTICHSQTRDIDTHCRRADILIAALGSARFVKANMVKPGATVIDVGVNRVEDSSGASRIVGDVDFENVLQVAGKITPNPGGVGPMTIAMLMANTVKAAEQARAQDNQGKAPKINPNT
jgi:methylenetetrahydrofolate dehydrogenase (NADP+) / methenyltetrahydrofolate cyclohydrolase